MGMRLAAGGGGSRFVVAQNSDINVTPFVDIMLVLLIIFMVAIPATVVSVKVDLPSAQAGDSTRAPTYVSLQTDGGLYIGDVRTSLSALPGDLARLIEHKDRVYVRADKKVSYEAFMAVMNTLRANGYEHVGLVAEEM
jgi:biopolymer transport protein ExbD